MFQPKWCEIVNLHSLGPSVPMYSVSNNQGPMKEDRKYESFHFIVWYITESVERVEMENMLPNNKKYMLEELSGTKFKWIDRALGIEGVPKFGHIYKCYYVRMFDLSLCIL